jgi:mxaJ protein
VDVAIVWGPIAGYFASREQVPLRLTPVAKGDSLAGVPFSFDVVMAVRSGDSVLARQLDSALRERHADISRLLQRYHVPLLTASAEVKR